MKSYIKTDKKNRIEGSPSGKKAFNQGNSNISFERILDVICKECHVSKEKILSNNRNAYTEYPRRIVIYLANILLNLPYDEIAKKLIGKDKTGVKAGVQYINHVLKMDTSKSTRTKKIIDKIKSILFSG